MTQFKTIGLFGRVRSKGVVDTIKSLVSYLKSLNQPFLIASELAQALNEPSLPQVALDELSTHCQLVIVVGGDGSILNAAHILVNNEVPVVGVNRGRLGFLTDINPKELHKIKDILAGKFILEKRFLLTATIEHEGKILGKSDALNEIALIPDTAPHMNSFEIYVGEKFLCSQNSDGIIIATPTGSTAYALSGGGPILHPQLDALVLVPMFPHSLNMRPIVIDANQRLTINISLQNNTAPRITADSREYISVPPGGQIHIQKKSQRLHLIHPLDYDYYESLRSKLHWGHKLHYTD